MSLLEQLAAEFGSAVVTRAPSETDGLDGMMPQAVATPTDETVAGALVAWCGRQNIGFIARGGGTQWHIGAPPSRFDVLISTENLTDIIDHDEGNATVEAGCGLTLAELDRQVRGRGQFVPFDQTRPGSTLGGTLATNISGGTRLKYGTPRDLVTGLRVALSDGHVLIGGSKVVKNVSGYDLPKIFTGSRGSLGLMTRAIIRLRPLPPCLRIWRQNFAESQAAATAARAIFDGPFEPALLRVRFADGRWNVEAQFEGGQNAVQTQLDRLPGGELISELSYFGGGAIEVRAQMPLQSTLDWLLRAVDTGAHSAVWDVGSGVPRVAFDQAAPLENIEELRAMATLSNGWMLVERAPLGWKNPDFVWGQKRNDWPLMQRLKAAYDAANVCAPGRFIGGL